MTGEWTTRGELAASARLVPCDVHPLPVLIILSLGVKEGKRRSRVEVEEWLAQHPLWTGNRWDPTPSTQITAKKTIACSSDRFKVMTAFYWNKRRLRGWQSAEYSGITVQYGRYNSWLTVVPKNCWNLNCIDEKWCFCGSTVQGSLLFFSQIGIYERMYHQVLLAASVCYQTNVYCQNPKVPELQAVKSKVILKDVWIPGGN